MLLFRIFCAFTGIPLITSDSTAVTFGTILQLQCAQSYSRSVLRGHRILSNLTAHHVLLACVLAGLGLPMFCCGYTFVRTRLLVTKVAIFYLLQCMVENFCLRAAVRAAVTCTATHFGANETPGDEEHSRSQWSTVVMHVTSKRHLRTSRRRGVKHGRSVSSLMFHPKHIITTSTMATALNRTCRAVVLASKATFCVGRLLSVPPWPSVQQLIRGSDVSFISSITTIADQQLLCGPFSSTLSVMAQLTAVTGQKAAASATAGTLAAPV